MRKQKLEPHQAAWWYEVSICRFGESLTLLFACGNSVVGGSLIIGGLYMFTWASYQERQTAMGSVMPGTPQASQPLIHEDGSGSSTSLHKVLD